MFALLTTLFIIIYQISSSFSRYQTNDNFQAKYESSRTFQVTS